MPQLRRGSDYGEVPTPGGWRQSRAVAKHDEHQTIEDCFLAGGLSGTAHRFAFLASRLLRKSAVASFHEARPHATRNVRHPNMAAHCKTNGAASSFYRQESVVCLLAFNAVTDLTLKRKSRVPTKRPRDSQPQALPVHPWSEHHGHLRDRSGGAQILGSRLARAAVCNDIEADVLSLVEGAHTGAFDRADMDENVFAAVRGLNETKALLAVKPLHNSLIHGDVLH